jgi:hypothetical protein
MKVNIAKESAALDQLSISELRQRYEELFNEKTTVHNRQWLKKRILWRLQSLASGDISERARQRALEIANDADLRMSPPKSVSQVSSITSVMQHRTDSRLPPPGNTIVKQYKGETHEVTVLENAFEYLGETYKSLSAVAKKISGSHCSGNLFFNIKKAVAR